MKLDATLLATLAVLGAAASAAAQPVTQPEPEARSTTTTPATIGLELLVPGDPNPDEIRAAIAAELGIALVDATAFAPTLGRIEIAIDAGVVRIAYHRAPGSVIERTVALPIARADQLQLIALITANLVDDHAGALLGALPPRARPAPPPTPVAAPPPPPHRRHLAFTAGFIPPLTIDRAVGDDVSIGVGLHVLVGRTAASSLFSASGVADSQRGSASGLQIGGVIASAGALDHGVQLAGVLAQAHGDADGAQLAGIVAVDYASVHGVQIAGGATAAMHSLDGIQLAGVMATTRGSASGLQIAGGVTYAREVHGAQIGGVSSIASRVRGLQLAGAANVGGDVRGMQIGLVNVASRMRGVQLGLVNVSDDGNESVPIGLINYSRNGRVSLDGWVESSRISALAFRHGTRHIQNTWGIGWSPDHDHVLVGAGLGTHHDLFDEVGLDLDAMHWLTDVWSAELGQINQLRATFGIPIVRGVEAFAGVAANVYVSDQMDDSADFHPTMARRFEPTDTTTVVMWPSVFAGIRLRAR